MDIEIIVKQKGFFKKPISLYKKLEVKYKCGTHDENYTLEDGKIDRKFLFYDPENFARGIFVEYDDDNNDMVKFGVDLPTSEHELDILDSVIEVIKQRIKCEVIVYIDGKISDVQEREKCMQVFKKMNKESFEKLISNLKDNQYTYLECVKNPIFLGKQELGTLDGKYDLFGEFLNLKQTLAYKYIEPVIYEEKNNKHVIIYKIHRNEAAILPHNPYVLANVKIKIEDAFIFLLSKNCTGLNCIVRYEDFLNEIPEKLYYDDKNFAMVGLSNEKMQDILEKYSLQDDCVNL